MKQSRSYRQVKAYNSKRSGPLPPLCGTDKAPQLLVQVGRYWIEFRGRCAIKYLLKSRARGFFDSLRGTPWKIKLPKKVIFSPCGVHAVRFVNVTDLAK